MKTWVTHRTKRVYFTKHFNEETYQLLEKITDKYVTELLAGDFSEHSKEEAWEVVMDNLKKMLQSTEHQLKNKAKRKRAYSSQKETCQPRLKIGKRDIGFNK